MKKGIFIYDNIKDPLYNRGVSKCCYYFSQGIGQAEDIRAPKFLYTKQKLHLKGVKNIPYPSAILGEKHYHYDDRFANFFADTFCKVFYSPYYGRILTKIPQVFTVYDMIFEKLPAYFKRDNWKHNRGIEEKKKCLYAASLLLCISSNTKKDLLEIYPDIPESRMRVIPLGVDLNLYQETEGKHEGKPYFLFVGNRGGYKNFMRMLMAFAKSGLEKDFDLRVVSPGKDEFTEMEKEVLSSLNIENSVLLETNISEEALVKRYMFSHALIFPSEYEGFGLPVLEAMAAGTLVLASKTASIPEVGGDVSIYFDPFSVDAITSALRQGALMPMEDRKELILEGRKRAAEFSWEKAQERFVQEIKAFL